MNIMVKIFKTNSNNSDKLKLKKIDHIKEPIILQKLLIVAKQLLTESTVDDLLSLAIDKTIELSNAERGMIILFGEKEEKLFQVARNLKKEDIKNPKFEVSRTIIKSVEKLKEPIYLENALEDPSLNKSDSVKRLRILSVICLPLLYDDQIFGVIYLDNRSIQGVFQQSTFDFVKELGGFISLAAYQALQRKQLTNNVSNLEKQLRDKYCFEGIIGHHPKMFDVLQLVSKVADSNATILIQGESGTGKELIAKAIHFNSSRKGKPFITINCGALPENLLESELFGHVRGAFTGAVNERIGWFEKTNGGTIFLDEVSEMSPALQVKLLRILQTGEYSKVGNTEIHFCDVRVVSATNKDLLQLVKDGEFRDDVFYRLNVVEITLPPLRERKSDIPLLIKHFLDFYNRKNNKNIKKISSPVENQLMTYNFPGNIRELENIMIRAITLVDGDTIEIFHLPPRFSVNEQAQKNTYQSITLTEAKRLAAFKAEKEFIIDCLEITKGHITKAAKIAGMDGGNFHRILTKHGINPADFK